MFVIAEQGLHTAKAFSLPHPTSEGAGAAQGPWKWGDTPGTGDPTWPEGHPRPYGIMISIQSWTKKDERGTQSVGVSLPRSPVHVKKQRFPRDG